MIKIRFYLSHRITGGDGTASYAEVEKNCKKAILIANLIRNALPSIELYVPGAETEEFVHLAHRKGYITTKQILDVDCAIIDGCEGVIVYVPEGDKLQGGRKVEYDYTVANKKPVFVFDDIEWIINRLAEYILRV